MRVIMESLFDVIYLVTVLSMGGYLVLKAESGSISKLYGWMAIILGLGDAFHLVPRMMALISAGPGGDVNAAFIEYQVSMGFGKAVTSITMTVFYLMLYRVWQRYYMVPSTRHLSLTMYTLAIVRIVLCFFPQNQWLSHDQPLDWGIYRNIPFALMGILMISLFFTQSKTKPESPFKWMWLAILLSFIFYAPVVLWSDVNALIGMLMIPKTMAYVWIVWMGFKDFKTNTLKSR